WLAKGVSWIRDNTPETTSRGGGGNRRVNGKDHKVLVLREHEDQGPSRLFESHGDRLSAKPHAQFGGPDVNRLWRVGDRAGLDLRCPSLQCPRMFLVSPVDSDHCSKFCRHDSSGE